MGATWLSIEVTLLGGRDDEFWPPPGRCLVVGPNHTFGQLGEAIDRALARWDLGHLRQFTMPDGTVITDRETAEALEDGWDDELPVKPVKIGPAIEDAVVREHVRVRDAFRYVFDLGDAWIHRCVVTEVIDPREIVGTPPRTPLAYFGWGSLPDQYGRRWADDDGESPVPVRADRDPMLDFGWPTEAPTERVAVDELRGATARRDVEAIVAAIEGHVITDALQHVGTAWQLVAAADPGRAAPTTARIVEELRRRQAPGDDLLAEDLLALQGGAPVEARRLPVDLVELAGELEGSQDEADGLLDLTTGEVVPGFLTDPAMGDDEAIDVDDEPDRWLPLYRMGSRDGWRDMADFAARVPVAGVREKLERAIEGKGAFRRFRDAVHREGLAGEWRAFSDERAMGRAREFLAANGIRATPPQRLS